MKPVSLADISYEQGLKLLLLRKQALDEGSVQRMPPAALANTFVMNATGTQIVKQAAGFLDTLTALPKQVADFAKGTYNAGLDNITTDPGLRSALNYSLAGAGLGAVGAGGLAASRKEKDWKRRLLQGATAGGLLGGGLGLAMNPGSITKHVEDAVAEAAGKTTQTGPTTEAQKEIEVLQKTKDTASSNPALGAAVPAGIGAGIGLGLSQAPKFFKNTGLDRRYVAEQWLNKWLSNPKDINAVTLEHYLGTKIAPPFSSVDEKNRQKLISELAKKIPLTTAPNQGGLNSIFQNDKALKTVAENARHFGALSQSSGPWYSRIRPTQLARQGLGILPALGGLYAAESQYSRDLAAKRQAQLVLDSAARGVTPEMLYGKQGPITGKDPSNVENAGLISRLLQQSLGITIPTFKDFKPSPPPETRSRFQRPWE